MTTFQNQLQGILLPTTTPFDSNQNVDFDGLRANLEKWSSTGITGLVLLGSTGERVHLDEQEYVGVIETARSTVSTEQAFIVGAGQQSTRGTINEIKRAA